MMKTLDVDLLAPHMHTHIAHLYTHTVCSYRRKYCARHGSSSL